MSQLASPHEFATGDRIQDWNGVEYEVIDHSITFAKIREQRAGEEYVDREIDQYDPIYRVVARANEID